MSLENLFRNPVFIEISLEYFSRHPENNYPEIQRIFPYPLVNISPDIQRIFSQTFREYFSRHSLTCYANMVYTPGHNVSTDITPLLSDIV